MSIKQENLIPYEGELKVGQRLVKVGDAFIPVGVGGAFEPGSVKFIEVGSGVYYKCVSVDATNGKWAGNKAIQAEDGSWSFESVITEGLSYINNTPVIGNIYTADASLQIIIPVASPWIDMPLTSKDCLTGQTVTDYSSSFSYDDTLKRNVMTTPGLAVSLGEDYSGDVSVSCFFRTTMDGEGYIFHIKQGLGVGVYNGQININSGHEPFYSTVNDGKWHHLIVVYDSINLKGDCYIDLFYVGSLDFTNYALLNPMCIGMYSTGRDYVLNNGAMSNLKVFKKKLDAMERYLLSQEITA